MGAQGRRYRAFCPRRGRGCERRQLRDGGAGLVLEVSRGGDTSRRNAVKPAYRSLALQTIVSGVIMYLVMFVMRSEEHTSELQSLMRISYAVFCLKKKKKHRKQHKQKETQKIIN